MSPRLIAPVLLGAIGNLASACGQESALSFRRGSSETRVLVFTKTAGFRHSSIEQAVAAIETIASDKGWAIDHHEDASVFRSPTVSSYDVVVFANTTGDILDESEQSGFEDYIRQGGGWVGIHSATDTEYDWPFYGGMIGSYFEGHPAVQEATLNVVDPNHPSTEQLPTQWVRTDEWYNFTGPPGDASVLLTIDEASYEGGTMGDFHPMAWFHEYEGGRAWYTAGGHTAQTYQEPEFIEHLAGGLVWAATNEKPPPSGTSGDAPASSTTDTNGADGGSSTGEAGNGAATTPFPPQESTGEAGEPSRPTDDGTETTGPGQVDDDNENGGCTIGGSGHNGRLLVLAIAAWTVRRRRGFTKLGESSHLL